MQQCPEGKNTNRSPDRCVLAAIAGAACAVFIGYFGTLSIGRVSVELRGAFPAVATDSNSLPYSQPSTVMTGISPTVFSSGWVRTKPNDRIVGLLAVVGRVSVDLPVSFPSVAKEISLPYSQPSTVDSVFFTVTAEINHTVLLSGWLRINPDDCIGSIQVNGIDVADVRKGNRFSRCWPHDYNIDLSPYLTHGPNKVKINLNDTGGKYGIDLAGIYSYPALVVMVTCAGMSLMSIYVLLCRWFARPHMKALRRYMAVGSMSLSGVLTLFFLQAVVEGRWTWMPAHDYLASHLPQLSIEFLPIPFAFLLWLRVIERDGPLSLRFSPFACALTCAAFTIMQEVAGNPPLIQYFFATAVISGLFVRVPFRECMRRAIHNPRPTFVAIVAGSAACSYYWLMDTIWKQMCGWTTQMVYVILHIVVAQVYVSEGAWRNASFIIASPHFSIEVYPGCNGLEGAFLFTFMLSVFFLYDWEFFKSRRILLLYVVGLIYMYVVNALRIAAFFTLGYWAHNPNAWEWVQSLKGAPLYLFHSNVGWILYLGAFFVFLTAFNRFATKETA